MNEIFKKIEDTVDQMVSLALSAWPVTAWLLVCIGLVIENGFSGREPNFMGYMVLIMVGIAIAAFTVISRIKKMSEMTARLPQSSGGDTVAAAAVRKFGTPHGVQSTEETLPPRRRMERIGPQVQVLRLRPSRESLPASPADEGEQFGQHDVGSRPARIARVTGDPFETASEPVQQEEEEADKPKTLWPINPNPSGAATAKKLMVDGVSTVYIKVMGIQGFEYRDCVSETEEATWKPQVKDIEFFEQLLQLLRSIPGVFELSSSQHAMTEVIRMVAGVETCSSHEFVGDVVALLIKMLYKESHLTADREGYVEQRRKLQKRIQRDKLVVDDSDFDDVTPESIARLEADYQTLCAKIKGIDARLAELRGTSSDDEVEEEASAQSDASKSNSGDFSIISDHRPAELGGMAHALANSTPLASGAVEEGDPEVAAVLAHLGNDVRVADVDGLGLSDGALAGMADTESGLPEEPESADEPPENQKPNLPPAPPADDSEEEMAPEKSDEGEVPDLA